MKSISHKTDDSRIRWPLKLEGMLTWSGSKPWTIHREAEEAGHFGKDLAGSYAGGKLTRHSSWPWEICRRAENARLSAAKMDPRVEGMLAD